MTNYYDTSVFNEVRSLKDAKRIILTPEDSTTEHRWETETPYLAELIAQQFDLHPRHQILDYGCGVGRISAELIRRYGCSVIGTDISPNMRALGAAYVESPKFLACAPEMLERAITPSDHAVCIWVLQHILSLDVALTQVERNLQPGGLIFVVDGLKRCLPSSTGQWVDDGKSVRGALLARFREVARGELDPDRTTPMTASGAYWAVFQHKG